MICHTGVSAEERPSRMTAAGIVTLGHDADELIAAHHQQGADVAVGHLLDGRQHRIVGANGVDLPPCLPADVGPGAYVLRGGPASRECTARRAAWQPARTSEPQCDLEVVGEDAVGCRRQRPRQAPRERVKAASVVKPRSTTRSQIITCGSPSKRNHTGVAASMLSVKYGPQSVPANTWPGTLGLYDGVDRDVGQVAALVGPLEAGAGGRAADAEHMPRRGRRVLVESAQRGVRPVWRHADPPPRPAPAGWAARHCRPSRSRRSRSSDRCPAWCSWPWPPSPVRRRTARCRRWCRPATPGSVKGVGHGVDVERLSEPSTRLFLVRLVVRAFHEARVVAALLLSASTVSHRRVVPAIMVAAAGTAAAARHRGIAHCRCRGTS